MDIRVRVHLAHFWKIRLFLALFGKSWYSSNCQHHCQQSSVYLQQLVVASAKVLEKSQIFQKCGKCTLTLMSKYEIDYISSLKCPIDLSNHTFIGLGSMEATTPNSSVVRCKRNRAIHTSSPMPMPSHGPIWNSH